MPVRLAVLISGGGTTLANLMARIGDGTLDATIEIVIASRPGLAGSDKAVAAGLPVYVAGRTAFTDVDAFSRHVFEACEAADVELVCLAGWLQLLRIPPRWAGRVLNIHPALLPKFGGRGMYGRHVHEAVLAAGEAESGCTVHVVTDEYDAGPVVLQRRCPVLPGDTPQSLAARVFEQECAAYPDAIRQFAGR